MSFLKTYTYLAIGYSFITFGLYEYNKYQYEKYMKEELKLNSLEFPIPHCIYNKITNLGRSVIFGSIFPLDISYLISYYYENYKQINNVNIMDVMFMHNPYFQYDPRTGKIYKHYVGYEQYINKKFLKSNENNDLL